MTAVPLAVTLPIRTLPPSAVQSTPLSTGHSLTTTSRVAPVSSERNRRQPRFSSVTTASWEPFGERPQLGKPSNLAISRPLPRSVSKVMKLLVAPRTLWKTQTVDGVLAHRKLLIPRSWSTSRGIPPDRGILIRRLGTDASSGLDRSANNICDAFALKRV